MIEKIKAYKKGMMIMKEITVLISCKCPVTVDFETEAEYVEDLTEEEIDKIFSQALDNYNQSLEYDYTLEEIESIE